MVFSIAFSSVLLNLPLQAREKKIKRKIIVIGRSVSRIFFLSGADFFIRVGGGGGTESRTKGTTIVLPTKKYFAPGA